MITPIPKNDFIYVYFNYHKNVLAHFNKFYIFYTPFMRNLSTFPKKLRPVHVTLSTNFAQYTLKSRDLKVLCCTSRIGTCFTHYY